MNMCYYQLLCSLIIWGAEHGYLLLWKLIGSFTPRKILATTSEPVSQLTGLKFWQHLRLLQLYQIHLTSSCQSMNLWNGGANNSLAEQGWEWRSQYHGPVLNTSVTVGQCPARMQEMTNDLEAQWGEGRFWGLNSCVVQPFLFSVPLRPSRHSAGCLFFYPTFPRIYQTHWQSSPSCAL